MDFKDKRPFEKRYLDEEGKAQDVITIKLNVDERKLLEDAKRILEQEKDATIFKQLAFIGFKSITSQENEHLLSVVFANKRRNKRLGVSQYEVQV
jgi:hypothetical protein